MILAEFKHRDNVYFIMYIFVSVISPSKIKQFKNYLYIEKMEAYTNLLIKKYFVIFFLNLEN